VYFGRLVRNNDKLPIVRVSNRVDAFRDLRVHRNFHFHKHPAHLGHNQVPANQPHHQKQSGKSDRSPKILGFINLPGT
jgi:hypothetical protein